jgi:hypothetical protein
MTIQTEVSVQSQVFIPRDYDVFAGAVNPSIMSEAGYGTVELLAPVLCSCRGPAPAA